MKPFKHILYATIRPAHWPSGSSVHQWPERLGFNPRLSHTKDFKNGT